MPFDFRLLLSLLVLGFVFADGRAQAVRTLTTDDILEKKSETPTASESASAPKSEWAANYFDPDIHLLTAKRVYDSGYKLQAFYLCEYARKLFGEEFDGAFLRVFGDRDRSFHTAEAESYAQSVLNGEEDDAARKPLLLAALQRYPKEGNFLINLGTLLLKEGDAEQAEQKYLEAIKVSPNSSHVQGWAGRFFLRARPNPALSLDCYLNAYFLNPHHYDTEHAEYRIRKFNAEKAEAVFAALLRAGRPMNEITAHENPTVVVTAMEYVQANWRAEYLPAVQKCLEHEDVYVRWMAMEAIKKNALRQIAPQLEAMLSHPDLRVRGLSLYLLAAAQKEKSFPVLRKMLSDDVQLIRYDAYSALMMEGGAEGRRIVQQQVRQEKHPRLRQKMMAGLQAR